MSLALTPLPGSLALDEEMVASSIQHIMVGSDLSGGKPLANLSACLRLEGRISPDLVQASLLRLAARHEGLRACFRYEDTRLLVRIREGAAWPLRVAEPLAPGEDPTARLRELGREQLEIPFDLFNGPLARAVLVPFEGGGYLVIGLHHAISDGWTVYRLARELTEVYGLAEAATPATWEGAKPLQLRDFIAWQAHSSCGETLEAAIEFWNGHLGAGPLQVPIADASPAARDLESMTEVVRRLRPEVAARIKAAKASAGGAFPPLFSALGLMLAARTSEARPAVAVPFFNRLRPGLRQIVGPLSNVLPVRVSLDPQLTLEQLVGQARAAIRQAQSFQYVHASRVMTEVAQRRGEAPTRPNIFFNFLFFAGALAGPNLSASFAAEATVGVVPSWCDLAFQVFEDGDDYHVEVLSYRDAFDEAELSRIAEEFESAVWVLLDAPDRTVGWATRHLSTADAI